MKRRQFSIVPDSIMDPSGKLEVSLLRLPPRPITLKGKTIGLLDNKKKGASIILGILREYLQRNFGVNNFEYVRAGDYQTFSVINKLSKVDAVIGAIGDCGSCTTWLVNATLKLEKMGVPTVTICSSVFVGLGAYILDGYGASNQPLVAIKGLTVAHLKEQEIGKSLESVYDDIVKAIASQDPEEIGKVSASRWLQK